MTGLAIPYSTPSDLHVGGLEYATEIIEPAAFRRSVETGLTSRGKPIPLVLGHKRNGRPRNKWILATTADTLRLWETEEGILFSAPGNLPPHFSGVSIRLAAEQWQRRGMRWRLLAGSIEHIALLTYADGFPSYDCTWKRTLELSRKPVTSAG